MTTATQRWALALMGGLFLEAGTIVAQNGDKAGEQQVERVPREKIPPAPVLAPADALKSFKLPPGFRLEIVASEPMIEMPVAIQFDADGRLWVLEMRGFMPNADGVGEKEPVGRVAVLEDTDGDGRMDRRTTFLDGLVMARAISLVRDGVLVAEPPKLWFCRDTNGDNVCDDKIEVAGDYGSQANPEHTANGLMWGMDNWIYSANHSVRFRNTTGRWERGATTDRGQWGISHDDWGRIFHDSNSDLLRADLVPSHYAARRGPGTRQPGLAVQLIKDQSVYPSRVNPGVNRGYQPKQLRPDGTLATATAACGPVVYRGDQFPAEFKGNAFVAEPSGNLVKRLIIDEKDGVLSARNAYPDTEFLTSTDERFRPVNLYNGPDGALYVVDLYHGILQHRIYLTSYLRKQAESRGLEKPQNLGRIYRVVHEGRPRGAAPRLAKAPVSDLVNALGHSNGWWRDTAQRLLVERGDPASYNALRLLAKSALNPVTRAHALWTLDGMGQTDPVLLSAAIGDPEPHVRAAAVRLAEPFLAAPTPTPAWSNLWDRVSTASKDHAAEPQIQAALTLGLVGGDAARVGLLVISNETRYALARDAARFSLAPAAGKPAASAVAQAPLSAADQKRVKDGKAVFEITCLGCHQQHGMGQEGLAPPMVGSEWVAGPDTRLIRIVLHGLRGPLMIKGVKWELEMPSLSVLDDQQIADVLSYVRNEWGHRFPVVSPETVKRVRAETAERDAAWTEPELKRVK